MEQRCHLTEAKDQAVLTLNASKGEILVAQNQIGDITKAHEQAKAMWSVCQSRVDDAQRVIAECKKDLESLSFNNALVKKLRAIRPMVANKLWNTVLSSVSVMFSQMRKEESWVTKEKAGFKVTVVPNQGAGAAMMRVEAARRLFPRIWFDEQKTRAGRSALAAYHEKRDAKRNIGLGPAHDWASHAADAFGLACVAYQEPGKRITAPQEARQRNYGSTPTSWMGA